jgi:hypothetical protein
MVIKYVLSTVGLRSLNDWLNIYSALTVDSVCAEGLKLESRVVLQRPYLKTRLTISTKVNFGGLPDMAPHGQQIL